MSNASRCRQTAARYARLAERAKTFEAARAFRALERLWLDMAGPADSFDRRHDGSARERIYAMIDAVEEERRKVA
jgi:hypothetical protein